MHNNIRLPVKVQPQILWQHSHKMVGTLETKSLGTLMLVKPDFHKASWFNIEVILQPNYPLGYFKQNNEGQVLKTHSI